MTTSMTTYVGRFRSTDTTNKQTNVNEHKTDIANKIQRLLLDLGIRVALNNGVITISESDKSIDIDINKMEHVNNESFKMFCGADKRASLTA